MANSEFRIHVDTITPALRTVTPRMDAAVDMVFDVFSASVESEMRMNAPWTDQTGAARAGLRAIHNAQPMVSHELVAYHSVHYGVWLEVRWNGRYAIIGPTLGPVSRELRQALIAAVQRAIG